MNSESTRFIFSVVTKIAFPQKSLPKPITISLAKNPINTLGITNKNKDKQLSGIRKTD